MHNLKKVFLTDKKFGFIPILLSLYTIRIIMSNGYLLKLLYNIDVEKSVLIDLNFIKLSYADMVYPLIVTTFGYLILKINNIRLYQFIILYFLLDFIHNLLFIYFVSDYWSFASSFMNAFSFSFLFLLLGLIGRNWFYIIIGFILGYGIGDQLGYYISFFTEHPELITEKLTLSDYIIITKLIGERMLIGFFGGLVYLLFRQYFPNNLSEFNNNLN